jgi:hypothetical protein
VNANLLNGWIGLQDVQIFSIGCFRVRVHEECSLCRENTGVTSTASVNFQCCSDNNSERVSSYLAQNLILLLCQHESRRLKK